MQPRKVVVLHCSDEEIASCIRFLLVIRRYRVLTVGEDSLDEEIDAYVVYKDQRAVDLIAENGGFQRTVFVTKYEAEELLERVRVAAIRKRGPKKRIAA